MTKPRVAKPENAGQRGSDQTVVFGVTADPVPHDSIFLHGGQSAIFKTDANRINIILAFQLFELQTGVRRVALEKTIGALGVALSAEGQFGKQTPELPCGPGLHQSRSSNGSVSPLSSSSRASRAIRRITWRFSAKRVFQASSSASEAKIWDAMASCSSWGSATTFSSAFSNSVDMPQFYQWTWRAAMPHPEAGLLQSRQRLRQFAKSDRLGVNSGTERYNVDAEPGPPLPSAGQAVRRTCWHCRRTLTTRPTRSARLCAAPA